MINSNKEVSNSIPPCSVCGSTNWKTIPALARLWLIPVSSEIMECKTCRLRMVSPQPSFNGNAANFEDEAYYREVVGSKNEFFQERVRFIQSLISSHQHRLLDIGCARGEMLVTAREAGFEVSGIELSKYACDYAKEHFDLNVENKTVDQMPANTFDVVHANHVLEHIHDPLQFLTNLNRILVKDGICVLEVPNEFMNLMARLNKLIGHPRQRSVPSIHLYFFEPATLQKLMLRAGFKNVRIRTRTELLPWNNIYLNLLSTIGHNSIRKVSDLIRAGNNIVCVARK